MTQHLPIWFLGNIPVDSCIRAAAEYKKIIPQDATMGKQGETIAPQHRNTTVRFAEKEHWFGKLLYNFGVAANKQCGWDYELSDHEAVQYATYGVGQHYRWHTDDFKLSGLPITRKVSVVCLMSDPSEFTDGALQLRLHGDYTPTLVKGSVIAFPSIIEHQVTPVSSGLRATATMWLSGPRFK